MIIELRNIHANVNYLYPTWVFYQQIRMRLKEVEQIKR